MMNSAWQSDSAGAYLQHMNNEHQLRIRWQMTAEQITAYTVGEQPSKGQQI